MAEMYAVPTNHPLMQDWNDYKFTESYRNTLRWAKEPRHVEGSLWAAFEQGWQAAQRRSGKHK